MKDSILRNPEQLGRSIRLRRQEIGLSQIALAAQVGVGRKWIMHLEAGNPRAELGLILKTLDALHLQASLNDKDSQATRDGPPKSSRLEEVFQKLQRPESK